MSSSLVAGLEVAVELDGPVALPLNDGVVLDNDDVAVYTLQYVHMYSVLYRCLTCTLLYMKGYIYRTNLAEG
jgi:hypothetical protein